MERMVNMDITPTLRMREALELGAQVASKKDGRSNTPIAMDDYDPASYPRLNLFLALKINDSAAQMCDPERSS